MPADLQDLAHRVGQLDPRDLLFMAMALVDRGELELAEQIAQKAVNKLAVARLTAARKERP